MRGSFEPVAEWWDARTGDEGGFFNRHLVHPAVMRLLGDVAGLAVLDAGCGNGSVSRLLARRGARVTGVDLSPTLIERARTREAADPLGIAYHAADAATLAFLPDGSFDRVVASMVLMDMEDPAGMFREAARLLRASGRFVASLLHPCFEVPFGSSSVVEKAEGGRRHWHRVWRYREPFSTDEGIVALDQPGRITRYHRPIGWYVSRLGEAGLPVEALDEPLPDEVFAAAEPEEYRRQQVIPFVMVIGARKVG